MTLNITKDSIDLGIVTLNPDEMLSFYEGVLGLEREGVIAMPGGGTMYRLKVGSSVIKIVDIEPKPTEKAAPGGIRAATGYRYWTITVGNLAEAVEKCRAHGCRIPVPEKVVREGITIAMVEDPDGNWVELLQIG